MLTQAPSKGRRLVKDFFWICVKKSDYIFVNLGVVREFLDQAMKKESVTT
jgi:hypothetical protein